MDKNIQYRLLNKEEPFRKGDQWMMPADTGYDALWIYVPDHLIGKPCPGNLLYRRRCYEEELLNAFKQIRDEHWEGLPGKAGDLILATIALAEGRVE